jgi:hypothetical protein
LAALAIGGIALNYSLFNGPLNQVKGGWR